MTSHKKSSFNYISLGEGTLHKTTSETTFDENFRVETPPTQMSLLKSNKKLASDVVVLPTAKVAPAPETIVEVLPHTDGPRFNLPKFPKLPDPTPNQTWRWQTDVAAYEDRPSTSGISSSSGEKHEDSDAMPSSSGEQFDLTKVPPRPMSRNTARWAPSAVTHKSKNTRQSQPDSSDDDDSFDESRSTGRPKSRYRVREAKPDDSKYKGPYSNYPDSHAPML